MLEVTDYLKLDH